MGSYRFLLASLVLTFHLGGSFFFWQAGFFAVFAFYVISGYLMTFVLNEVYHFRLAPYAANRALRLLPPYYLVAIPSLILILVIPGADRMHAGWNTNVGFDVYLENLFLVPLAFDPTAPLRVVISSWSVAVEIVNYLILWAVVARSAKFAVLAIAATAVYHVVSLALGLSWATRYSPVYAALLPFAVGAGLYFFRRRFGHRIDARLLFAIAAPLWLGNLLLSGVLLSKLDREILFYLNILFAAGLVLSLVSGVPARISRIDRWLGDLSYPIFLVHWIVGFLIVTVFPGFGGIPHLALVFAVTVLVAVPIAWSSARLIDPIRSRVRAGALRLRPPDLAPRTVSEPVA